MDEKVTVSDGPLMFTLEAPHVTTLPGGSTVVLPAGTVLRPISQKECDLRGKLAAAYQSMREVGDMRDGDALDVAWAEVERLEAELAQLCGNTARSPS